MAFPARAGQFKDAVNAYERGDFATAFQSMKPFAEQGNDEAQHTLGRMYAIGQGVPQDFAEAMKWFRKAAEQGNVKSQCNLGQGFLEGLGVPQDYGEAAKWYRKAAEQGEVSAQFNLGVMYANGEGVPGKCVKRTIPTRRGRKAPPLLESCQPILD